MPAFSLFAVLYLCSSRLLSIVTARPSNFTSSCVGDIISTNCTVNSPAHAWKIEPLREVRITSGTSETEVSMGFTFQLVSTGSSAIVSSATGTVFAGLNNSVILCRDALVQPGEGGEQQEGIIQVFGPPPPPLLITAAVDHQAVAFSILPQLEGLRCVLNYTITATSRVGNVLPPIVVEATGNGEPITHIEAGFDLCNNTYTFYATANTLTYIGHRSMEVSPAFALSTMSPSLEVVAVDPDTFYFTLTPQSAASQCVLHYNITPSTSDGSTLPNITVIMSEPGQPVTFNRNGYNTCGVSYVFSVVAAINDFTGELQLSEVADPSETDFFGTTQLTAQISGFTVTLSGTAMQYSLGATESTTSIQRSVPNGDSCEVSVYRQNHTGATPTITDTLSCRYAGQMVTYCLQFSISSCSSQIAMDTVQVPSLLSGVSTSWTPEGVAISVVTTKQVFCERADRLGITTTMSNSSGLFPSQTAAGRFADGTIVINDTGLSPGTYTCTIVVIDQSGPVEYQTTSCQVGVRNITVEINESNMSVVIGASVGVPVAVIVIASVTVALVIIIIIKNRGPGVSKVKNKYNEQTNDKESSH